MLRAFDAWNSILLVLTCHNEDESFQIISLSMDPNLYLYLMTAKLKLHMASLIEKFFHTFIDVSTIHRLSSDYLGDQQTCAAYQNDSGCLSCCSNICDHPRSILFGCACFHILHLYS